MTSPAPRPLPRIALTMGDPAGVGPEICLDALNHSEMARECQLVVIGDGNVLARVAQLTGRPFNTPQFSDKVEFAQLPATGHVVLNASRVDLRSLEPGICNAATGAASFEYFQTAINAALDGQVQAITTAPISKEALWAAGLKYPGHTEILAERTQSTRSCMMQYSEEITCTFVTTHIGYAEVPAQLSKQRILDVIELSAAALHRIRQKPPVIVVCGLNPHAGEHGLFGNREEETVIQPAIDAARNLGFQVEGPLPPDTAFLPAKRRATDVFVCMYHDQGHIPVKALAFDNAVNTTLGLPIIRTSVDHGTAADIAWKNLANPSSLYHALRLAIKLSSPL